MNKQSKLRWLSLATAAALVAATAGCHNGAPSARLHGETFEDDDAPRAVSNIAAVQSSIGARADATLYSSHFNAAGLNSLGRQKLDMMLDDDESVSPLVVYLDMPKGDAAKQAHLAVADYLKGRGVADTQFKIEDGANPRTIHRAEEVAAGVDALKNTGANASGQGGQPQGNAYTSPGSGGASQGAAPANH